MIFQENLFSFPYLRLFLTHFSMVSKQKLLSPWVWHSQKQKKC